MEMTIDAERHPILAAAIESGDPKKFFDELPNEKREELQKECETFPGILAGALQPLIDFMARSGEALAKTVILDDGSESEED